LDVCTLHRFGVSVRAGLISRVSSVRFEDFESNLLKPLEHVVRTFMDPSSRDHAYRTRHQEIARVVFEYVLDSAEKRVEQIIRILKNMDIDYSSDEKAFREIIKGKNVAEAFSDRILGERIYRAAEESGADKSYVFQQKALFEVNHVNGDLTQAMSAIEASERLAKHGVKAIRHTKAIILRLRANKVTNELERDKLRQEAKGILKTQLGGNRASYSYHALGSILLDEVRDAATQIAGDIGDSDLGSRVFEAAVSSFEDVLHKGLQEHPGDEHLLMLEAHFSEEMNQQPRALSALERAKTNSPQSCYVAIALSKIYSKQGEHPRARDVLLDCLESNPGNKQAHLRMALALSEEDEAKYTNEIRSHLRKSFTDGDSNYDAQFWFSRHEFLYGDRSKSEKYFGHLGEYRLPPGYRDRKRGVVRDRSGETVSYVGTVSRLREDYCFVDVATLGCGVFVYRGELSNADWDDLTVGSKVSFNLAFSLRGPSGINVQSIS